MELRSRKRHAVRAMCAVMGVGTLVWAGALGHIGAEATTTTMAPAFNSYPDPLGLPHQPAGNGTAVTFLIGEPSIGVDWATNTTLFQGDLNTFAVTFDYSKKPAVAAWRDRSDLATDTTSLDARLFTDHAMSPLPTATSDRTVVTQLAGEQSAEAYTDDNGGAKTPPRNSADWVASSAGGFPSGVDHESIGAGPYAKTTGLPTPAYAHAWYYCSQYLVGAFCARSDDGGATWNPGVNVYGPTSPCGGLHGKPSVGPDGTVYLPNKDCGGRKGVLISKDNGQTWKLVQIPNTSTDGNQPDPDVSVGGSGHGNVYYAYRDGDHHPKVVMSTTDGSTWSAPVDLGAALGIQNAQFPEVVAGDASRAAVTFIGTKAAGNDLPDGFTDPSTGKPAVWYLYVALTYDSGKTWTVVNATPGNPVQRGGVCMSGTGCSGNDRNMLDFNDIAIDRQGRAEVAFTDGCTGTCVGSATGGSQCAEGTPNCKGQFSSIFTISDQVCGKGLFAKYDPGFNNGTQCVAVAATPATTQASSAAAAGVGFLMVAVGALPARFRKVIRRQVR